jgi:hypothetical protein
VTVFHRVGTQLNTVGGEYTFDADLVARRFRSAVRRKLALFGSGGGRDPAALYRIGPYDELVGRRAAALRRMPGSGMAEINEAADLANVDPESDFVPGELTGQIHAGVPGGGRPIAVAVNGTIAATGRTFSLEGSSVESFEVIVPETAFRRGRNETRVFEIVPRGGGGVALRPL